MKRAAANAAMTALVIAATPLVALAGMGVAVALAWHGRKPGKDGR